MIVTFCGHRDYIGDLNDEQLLLELFEKTIKGEAVQFYIGGYGNFDKFALKCAKLYKNTHPNATIVFITPYLNKWLNDRKSTIEACYDTTIYPPIENTPQNLAVLKRNEWMVGQADYVFAYVKAHYGGAYKTLLYAHKHNKPYTNLYQGDYKLY